MTPAPVPLSTTRIAFADDFSTARCARCDGSLDLHQPDTRRPHRILAVCRHCECWYLMNVVTGLVLLLPDDEDPGAA